MKTTTATKVGENSYAKKKGKNNSGIRWMLRPPLIITHQIDENTIRKMVFMRNRLYDWIKTLQELVTISVEFLLI